ncbi:MAG: glucose 1-dehydrogenase [Actinobacteria bacterium]|nr:glucose 1-dehydrogenase [Actinomycetota bacterium]
MHRFEGETVVITGAASGIGAEMARLFAVEGAFVVGGDIMPDDIPGDGMKVRVDVSNEDDVAALIRQAQDKTGRLDILCNNAGIGSTADPISCSLEEWDRVFSVNVRGVFLGTKYALPIMLGQGRGAIINTASIAGLVGLRDRAAYCASKGAVVTFTKQVAVQYAGTGVRCNCICPGTVDSPWVQRLLDESDDPSAMRDALVARQPVGRLAEPREIAAAALYLASKDAEFITGTSLVIDGGLLAG